MTKKHMMIVLMILLSFLVMSAIPSVHAWTVKVDVEIRCDYHGKQAEHGEDWDAYEAKVSRDVECRIMGQQYGYDAYAYAYARKKGVKGEESRRVKVECHPPGRYAYAKAKSNGQTQTSTGPTEVTLDYGIYIMQAGVGYVLYEIEVYDLNDSISLFSGWANFSDGVFAVGGNWSTGDWSAIDSSTMWLSPGVIATVPDGHEFWHEHIAEANITEGIAEARNMAWAAVGGVWAPVDKFGLLAPYIVLASTILVATAATAIYVKRRKKER